MEREILPPGHVLVAREQRYQIIRKVGGGGFGVTYEATRMGADDQGRDPERTRALNQHAFERVAVKEYYPEDIARKVGGRVVPTDDDGARDTFDRALDRFKREAERLYFLTRLRALRAALAVPRSGPEEDEIRETIKQIVSGHATAQYESSPGGAQLLVERLTGPMADAASYALAHSPLPIVHDYFATETTAYYVMEFLGGGSLKDRLTARKREFGERRVESSGIGYALMEPWTEPTLRTFASAGMQALEELHVGIPGQQLVHCDLKPGNIMFRNPGSQDPVLIDFGLARNTSSDRSRILGGGTPGYAAIEIDPDSQPYGSRSGADALGGSKVGPWTDIYALAVILRMLATGLDSRDFPRAYRRAMEVQLKHPDPVTLLPPFPPGFDTRFARGIDRGYGITVTDRPQSIAEWRGMMGLDRADQAGDRTMIAAPAVADSWGPGESTVIAREDSRSTPSRGARSQPSQHSRSRGSQPQTFFDDEPEKKRGPGPGIFIGIFLAAALLAVGALAYYLLADRDIPSNLSGDLGNGSALSNDSENLATPTPTPTPSVTPTPTPSPIPVKAAPPPPKPKPTPKPTPRYTPPPIRVVQPTPRYTPSGSRSISGQMPSNPDGN